MTTGCGVTTLHAALLRKFAITAATPSRGVTEFPDLAADLAAGIAEAFIEQARAEERERCAALLRERAADLVTAAGSAADLLRAAHVTEAADLLDPPRAPVPPQ
jgi:hypothetical protein